MDRWMDNGRIEGIKKEGRSGKRRIKGWMTEYNVHLVSE